MLMPAKHIDSVVDACSTSIQAQDSADEANLPPLLYHLTDLDGLTGILSTGNLWASLATALNDSSEVRYGYDLAVGILRERQITAPSEFSRRLLRHLVDRSTAPPGNAFELFPFVTSFCGRKDRSGMWLHYGRGGKGIALGFDSRIAADLGMNLSRVDYDRNSQVSRMAALLDAGLAALGSAPSYSELADGAHLTSLYVSWLAVRLKHPSFSDEHEWRLSSHAVVHNGSIVDSTVLKYRRSGERLIPYEVRTFADRALVKEIVLGHSCPVAEEAIKILMYSQGYQADISRSEVPVR
jgi:hypothetical protein